MTNPDHGDTAPGKGDPTKSDDIDSPGLRSDTAGSGAENATDGPAPHAGSITERRTEPTDWLRSAEGDGGEADGGGTVDRGAAR